ncbi:MAG: hypothetical protein HY670_06115 [Chloroflexi bacterium]|nr:hypothetical protein [Chloroflexota bacterium]
MFRAAVEYGDRIALSRLAHHGKPCCSQARAWFLMMDRFYHAYNRALPVWIRLRYEWGPSRWPVYWCEAVESKKLDCGVLSALTIEALAARGVTALFCQLIQHFDSRSVAQWREVWSKAGSIPDWATGQFTYHEACAVIHEDDVTIWDPTINAVVRPVTNTAYGAVIALRVRAPGHEPASLSWGNVRVPVNEWVFLENEQATIRNGPACAFALSLPASLAWSGGSQR